MSNYIFGTIYNVYNNSDSKRQRLDYKTNTENMADVDQSECNNSNPKRQKLDNQINAKRKPIRLSALELIETGDCENLRGVLLNVNGS